MRVTNLNLQNDRNIVSIAISNTPKKAELTTHAPTMII